jgi:CDP-diacylglycerol---glycerol-3-phosphate 3-phosphatidyltransferase
MPHPVWNIPNALSASRVPLGCGLFACIAAEEWRLGLVLFGIAALTDWLDGFWARRWGPMTPLGRNLDPLTDKFLICGALIYLMPVVEAALMPWMVTLIIAREILVTGIRGIVEAEGHKFGADGFGKIKTVVQCGWILAVLAGLAFRSTGHIAIDILLVAQLILLILTLFTTAFSGLSYFYKASILLSGGSLRKRSGAWIAVVAAVLLGMAAAVAAVGPPFSDTPTAPPNSPEYALPWHSSIPHLCFQGNTGWLSHNGRQQFAYDFAMPIGTPVLAARAGSVNTVEDRHDGYGIGAAGNGIIIDHGDGTFGVYWHIRRGGAVVQKGDRIERGQVIAFSGNVGNSLIPHLHFHVADRDGNSIPIRWVGVAPKAWEIVRPPEK